MIQFLRRIRKNLLTNNKFSKYLLYAIGEILLVVIGILLALQLNTWNENQRARADEKNLLENLFEDLNAAGAQSQNFIIREKLLIDKLIRAMGIHPDGQDPPPEFYQDSSMIDMIWEFETNVPVVNSYAEIKNTGKTSLIRSREIRQKFTNLELSINALNNLVKDRLSVQQLRIDNIAAEDINLVRFADDPGNNLHVNLEQEPVNDYPAVFKRQKVRNLLAMKLLLTRDVLRFRIELQKEIELIAALIEEELQGF